MNLQSRLKSASKVLKPIAQLLVIGVTTAYVVRAVATNWSQVAALDIRLRSQHLVALGLALVYLVGRGLLWHRIVRKTVGDMPLRLDVACWLASQLGKYVPGKVVLVLGRVIVYRERGASAAGVGAAFLLEMLALFSTASLLALLASHTSVGPVPLPFRLMAAGAFAGFVALCHPRWFRLAAKLVRRYRAGAPDLPLHRFRDALSWIGLMTLDWAILGSGFFLLADSLVALEPTMLLPLTAAFALAGTAGILVLVAPSGLGVREGVLTALLAPVLGAGVAAALAILARLWMTAAEVLSALAALPFLRSQRPLLSSESPSVGEAPPP